MKFSLISVVVTASLIAVGLATAPSARADTMAMAGNGGMSSSNMDCTTHMTDMNLDKSTMCWMTCEGLIGNGKIWCCGMPAHWVRGIDVPVVRATVISQDIPKEQAVVDVHGQYISLSISGLQIVKGHQFVDWITQGPGSVVHIPLSAVVTGPVPHRPLMLNAVYTMMPEMTK